MKSSWFFVITLELMGSTPGWGQKTVFEVTSPYHHITVVDSTHSRVLHFDASTQSRMSLEDPRQGHFEYTEYFHMPWLWNNKIKSVLMIGLGGSSIQRAYQHDYPEVMVETVELDPKVVEVAKQYFQFKETETMKVILGDGRMHLRRTSQTYDLIILDAYTANRYGSYIPYSLATQEFFALVKKHLHPNGILAYNAIGKVSGSKKNLVGSLYKTLKTSFPQVYTFSALTSYNAVLIATVSKDHVTPQQATEQAQALIDAQRITLPNFKNHASRLRTLPPTNMKNSPLLTDDFAPVNGLLPTE